MSDFLTFTARAKIKKLISKHQCICIKIIFDSVGSLEFRFLYASDSDDSVIICNNPYVSTDMQTFTGLKEKSINFNYETDNFEITK